MSPRAGRKFKYLRWGAPSWGAQYTRYKVGNSEDAR